MDPQKLWQQTLRQLELSLSKPTFQTWFKDKTSLVNLSEGIVEIGCPKTYSKEFVENRYGRLLKQIMSNLSGERLEVRFVVDPFLEKPKASQSPLEPTLFQTSEPTLEAQDKRISLANLNSKYTFESFVVGNNNRLAHAVAVSVAKSPAKSYNPFFLYGGVGVGKTHLMQAIGHEILKTHPKLSVLYCTGEAFTNEMIAAIQTKRTQGFRSKFRGIDVLLIDDISFIAGRDTTQEEFFHTFNDLHSGGKQIVMTSDRPPKDIAKLEMRVRSRFEWGMLADIQPPDTDMREAILLSKCKQQNLNLSSEVLHFLAENVTSSIRDLEGSLTRLVTTATMLGKPLDLNLARQAVGPSSSSINTPKRLAPKEIIETVCDYYSVKITDIKSHRRNAEIARPRQVIMYLLRTELGLQFMSIAKLLGGRDHTTIIHGVERIKKEVDNSGLVSGQIGEIKTLFNLN